jgi:AcrR family transcriptional regulator
MAADGVDSELRADARRNRAQILDSAKRVFAQRGPDLPMEEIARHAGVGVGTLYRRFPERDDLIRAVARESFTAVLADAHAAAAEEPTRWAALERLARRSRELQLTLQLALLSARAWAVISADPATKKLRNEFLRVLEEVVRAAQAEGSLRDDVGFTDVVVVLSLLLRAPPVKDDKAPIASERAMALLLDGLRTSPGGALPGRPISHRDLGFSDPYLKR